MRLSVRVKPGSKKPGIEKSNDSWTVRVRERALENKANLAVIEAVAEELGVPKSRVRIASGETSRTKILEILD